MYIRHIFTWQLQQTVRTIQLYVHFVVRVSVNIYPHLFVNLFCSRLEHLPCKPKVEQRRPGLFKRVVTAPIQNASSEMNIINGCTLSQQKWYTKEPLQLVGREITNKQTNKHKIDQVVCLVVNVFFFFPKKNHQN